MLRWSNLSVTPDHQVFVADDYFSVEGSRRFRKLLEDPLSRIDQQQDEEVRRFAVAGNLTETDVNLVDQLLTDGGHLSPADLAERIDVHISTCYKSLKRLGSIVRYDYGSVELASLRASLSTSTPHERLSRTRWRRHLTTWCVRKRSVILSDSMLSYWVLNPWPIRALSSARPQKTVRGWGFQLINVQ